METLGSLAWNLRHNLLSDFVLAFLSFSFDSVKIDYLDVLDTMTRAGNSDFIFNSSSFPSHLVFSSYCCVAAINVLSHHQEGGAICIGVDGELKFLERAKVTFTGNNSGTSGGQVNNDGTLVLRNTGVFSDGYAGGSGGAIFAGDFSSML